MDADADVIRNSCSFRNIQNVHKPTVSGKIVDVLPLVRKSRTQSNTVLIFHCIDVSPDETNPFKKFKIMFFAEAAEKMWSLKLGINDYIAIREAVAYHDYAYSNTDLFYSKVLVIKSLLILTKRVLFRKNKEAWTSLKDDLSEKSKKPYNPDENTNVECAAERTEIVSSSNGFNSPTKNEANDSGIGIISSTNWLMAVKKKTIDKRAPPTTEPDHDKSESSNISQLNENPDPTSPSKENYSRKFTSPSKAASKKISPESVMHGIVRCFQHKNNEKNITSRNVTSQLKCVYTKLGEVQETMVVNTVAVVLNVPDVPIATSHKKYCMFIYVADDTKSDGFRIRIFFNKKEDRPILQTYCIILCHEMKISKIRNELCGTIYDSLQIVTFDKDDTNICYKQSSNYCITPEDKERVQLLRNWMFENIPVSRPFTPLASIVSRNMTVNLRCQIVDLKKFDKNIIVLRLSDSTTCEVPFHRVPFECESWQSALSETKSNRKPSKEIDIIVHVPYDYLYKKFKEILKAGFTVELYNVKLILVPDSVKTRPGHSLKALLDGTPENIKIIPNSDKLSRIKNSNKYSTGKDLVTNQKLSEIKSKGPIIRFTNKRKLFEHSPRNETVDSDKTDFENSLDMSVVSPKKSKSVVESNNTKLVGLTTFLTGSTSVEKSNTTTIQDIISNDNLQTNVGKGSDKEQLVDLTSDTNFAVQVLESHSTALIQYVSDMDSQFDSILLDNSAKEQAASKSVRAHLHQSFKSVVASERKAMEERIAEYNTRNDVRNYLVQWPSDPGDEAFYIQVTIMSTIPFINGSSSDFELLALISGYCERCDRFFPFYLSKWIVSDDDGPVSICPKCKENDVMSSLKHELLCELLLCDEYGNSVTGIVMSHHAENFFGCTVSQLCSSVEAKIRVRTFIDCHVFAKGKEKRPLIIKVIRIYSSQNNTYKYHILS